MHEFSGAPNGGVQFPIGGGAMGALLRATDWSGSVFGPLQAWPAALRTVLNIVLNAQQPMMVLWGDASHMLYNDSYRAILGARAEPAEATFGRPLAQIWPELDAEFRPLLQDAHAGSGSCFHDFPCVVERNGYPEEIYLTVSATPVFDDGGATRGVFFSMFETTGQVRARQQRDLALEGLKTSNDKLRLATDIAELGLFDHLLQTDEIEWSAQTRRHFGLAPDAPVLRSMFADAFHPDDRDRMLNHWQAFFASPGDGRYEAEYRTIGIEDKQERWLAARGQLSFDAAGRPLRLVGTTLDISERKRAEAAVRQVARDALAAAEANAKYKTFFSQGSHFAGLLSCAGIVLEVNRLSLERCGYTQADVLGHPFWSCAWFRGAQASVQAVHDAVLRAASGETEHVKLRYYDAGGQEYVGDMVFGPVTDEHGKVLYLAVSGADVTEREQVEARLRLLDDIGEATRVASEPRAILDAATRMLGEHLGATRIAYADLEADNDRFTIRHDWTTAGASSTVGVYSLSLFGSRATANMRGGQTLLINDVDAELRPDDGSAMFNQIGVQAIICCPLVRNGRLMAMMAAHQDTPRRWSEAEVALVEAVVERCWAHIERVRSMESLRESDQRKSEFLAVLAHELRNPLAPIRNGIEMLRLSAHNPTAMARVREMMERQVGHMVHMINDLMDVARVNNGKIVLQRERVALQAVVSSAIEASLPLMEAGRHSVSVDMGAEPLDVDADPVRLAQILANLLSNAAKYTPPGGHISVTARRDGAMLALSVRDTGVGIPPEHLASVFDMFTQVSRSLERARGGLGIGLSLVQRLVELHGGTVRAESAGEGQGSTFTVRLPATPAAAPRAPAVASSAAAAFDTAALRILVADDNVDAADSLAALLAASGCATRVAYDGAGALALAADFRPHLAFLDIGMPNMDGYETAQRLRADLGLADAVLVALTGWGAETDRERSRDAGFDHHLLKPAAMAEVQKILDGMHRTAM